MNQYLLIKQGNIHNAVEKEAFTADILIENGNDLETIIYEREKQIYDSTLTEMIKLGNLTIKYL